MTHLPLKQIDPQTTGLLRITVTDGNGALVTGATAVADVYQPSGKRVANDVALSEVGSGVYSLTINATWSEISSVAVLGVYAAVITVVKSGQQRTKRFKYLVDYTE